MSLNENFYRFDDVTMDCENFRVQKNGQNITLTPRAFDVLLFLIKNGGRVVEKQEIFDQVWKDTFVGDNALTKIVKEIRRALADDAGNPHYIETVPKRGYRFLPEVQRSGAKQTIVAENPPRTEEGTNFQVDSSKSEIQKADGIQNFPVAVRDSAANSATKRPGAEIRPEDKQSEPRALSKFLNFFKENRLATIFIAACLIIIATVIFARSRFSDHQSETSPAAIDSIAVLPFENATRDINAEYLSEGITENLINRLSQLPNIKVMSRSSVFRYQGSEQDVKKIGSELNVKAVLTGSVKQIGDQLVIIVRLDDTRNNQQIWGEQYVRRFSDVLTIQNDIVQEVSTHLQVKLTSADEGRIAKRYTNNVEAYQLYLKGQYEWKKHTQEDLQKGIEYFNQALEKDPNYALAYFGLSASYGVLGNQYLPPNEAFPKAKIYAAKALSIDDTLAEAHTATGAVKLYYEWDWAEAEKELKRAQTLDPNNAEPHSVEGDYLDAMGRFEESKAERKRAQELDLLSPSYNSNLGITFYFARQNSEAITQFEKTINLEPRNVDAWTYLGQTYEQKKMFGQAIATYQKGMVQAERHPNLIAALGHAYALAGERGKANQSLNELREMSKQQYISPYLFAVVYCGLGDKDQTFAWLDKAYQERSIFLIWLKVEPIFDSLHQDQRFQDLVFRVGL